MAVNLRVFNLKLNTGVIRNFESGNGCNSQTFKYEPLVELADDIITQSMV